MAQVNKYGALTILTAILKLVPTEEGSGQNGASQ
jgi:hypothetical protein